MKNVMRHWLWLVLLAGYGCVALRALPGLWPPGFLHSLQLHLGAFLVAVALFLLLLAQRAGKIRLAVAWTNLAGALAITAHALLMIAIYLPPAPANGGGVAYQRLKVMSFNVLGDNLENGRAIAEMIRASGADIAYVMEAEPVGQHLDRLTDIYPYRIGCGIHTDTCDLMLLSKYPLTNIYVGTLSDLRRDRFAMAKISVHGAPLRLVAAHLSKPYFDDYHIEETDELADVLEDFDGPLLLAGDFNASILAPDMQNLLARTGLTTAGIEPATWPIAAGRLGVAIDHIFIRQPLAAEKLERLPSAMGSNHYGLMAELLLPGGGT
ncbi:endonuclease/exonuclease/phosphatase family protein [Allorhizobium undicola]|uniref:endonuclease/exonuclease/phosphatase family protein n=1 Tax=Allorhizobium undicola TaxID=78527 RepID=UPI0006854DA1|nr:endonuclease/exonuclease/phosphatase family protein [Allorhizobium undicola]